GPVWIVVLAGLAGFLAGQSLNSFVVSRMKRRMGERGLIARLFTSSALGELVDTIIFCAIASVAIGLTTFQQYVEYTVLGVLYKAYCSKVVMPIGTQGAEEHTCELQTRFDLGCSLRL